MISDEELFFFDQIEELFFFDQIEELFLELDIGRTGEQKSKDLATSAVRRIREQIG